MQPEIVVADRDGIALAAARIRAGGLVAYPTETWYALGCDPRNAGAVRALREAKGRPGAKPLPLVAGSLEQAIGLVPSLATLAAARSLAAAFWPGPLSVVLPAAPGVLAPGVAAPDGTVAIRWTPHPVAAALARAAGVPLVATSANRAGEPPAGTAADVVRNLGAAPLLLVVDGGPAPGGLPSTLVDPRPPGGSIPREGAVPAARVREVLLRGEAARRQEG